MSDSWPEVEAIFADAVALASPADRAALVERRCGGREALRREIESLLASHEGVGSFLDVSPAAGPAETTASADRSGETIGGRYRLLEKMAAGGMGVVYRGARADGEYDGQVAIKLLAAPILGADGWRRFRLERQVLARLNHPDIVTLLDGGVTERGQPYLVMSVVEGVSITEYCAAHRLPLADRLRLFQRVCAAVQHAHQNGVVHRDLKPANILVTTDGLPKVLDFGIAKLLDHSEGVAHATVTALHLPLTPNYASPEQLRGLPVTTACDVYALGVLLYELLTGARPYDTTDMPLDELVATVVDRAPRRPSAVAPDQPLPYNPRQLAGDLDAIVLKAMSKEPERRYASTQELADDCGRHLAGQPVAAREPSFAYQASRLARRHRAAFVAAAISAAALVAALGVSLWQTRVAVAERNRAAARFNEVRQLANALIFRIHDEVQPLPGSTPVRQTIVSQALTYLDTLSREPGADAALRLELAKAYHRIGGIQGNPSQPNLGDRDAALSSLRRAVSLLTPVAGPDAGARDASLELGRAQITLTMVANISGKPEEAVAAAGAAAALAEAMVAGHPEDDEARRLWGSALFQLALITGGDGAIARWERAGEVFRALLARRPDDPDRQRNVALVEKYLGGTYATANDLPKALARNQRALALDQQRADAHPADRRAQFDVAVDLTQIGGLHRRLGAIADAAAHTERALTTFSALADSDPKDVLARVWVLESLLEMGRLEEALGDTAALQRTAVRAVDVGESLRTLDPFHEVYFGEALTLLGLAQRNAGRADAACAALRRADGVLSRVREADLSPPSVVRLTTARQTLAGRLAGC